MATTGAKAAMDVAARERLGAAMAGLCARLGLDEPAPAPLVRDHALRRVREVERFAVFAEAVLAAMPAQDANAGRGVAEAAMTAETPSKTAARRSGGKARG